MIKLSYFSKIITFLLLIDFSVTRYISSISSKKEQNMASVISGTRISHPVYHHTFSPNYSEIIEHSVLNLRWREDTNSLGFKDNKIREINLKSNDHRIVFIGDSITEGIGYTFDDTFVGIISNSLKDEGVEVLNAARVSYSPIIYWRKIKFLIEDEGLDFDELIVLVDMSDIQDEHEIYKLDENQNVINKEVSDNYLKARELVIKGDNTLPFTNDKNVKDFLISVRKWITDNTTFTYFIANSIYDLAFDEKTRVPYLYLQKDYTRFSWPYYEKAYNEFAVEGIKNSINYMDLLLKLLKDHNIKLTVGVYPLPNNIYFDEKNSKHVKVWRDWTNENNVGFFNLFPKLVDSTKSKKEKMRLIDEYYIKYDMHFNHKGHSMFAQEFLNFYKSD